jgi:hypothetical protein
VGANFVVAWHSGSERRNWGSAIHAVVVDGTGAVLASRDVTAGDLHAKDRSLLGFGDHLLLVWSATPSADRPFELSYETLSAGDLSLLGPRQSLVRSASGWDLTGPFATRGAAGDVGIFYDEIGSYKAYFLRLGCGGSGP